jgi:membrane-bound lytic murein transglycosylase D
MGSRSLFALPLLAVLAVSATDADAAPPAATPPVKPATSATPGASAKPAGQPGAKTAQPAAKNANAASRANRSSSDTNVRRSTAGGPTYDDGALGADTPELRALFAAEKELFPPASPSIGTPWPQELPFPIPASEDRPRVHASGLPPAPPPSTPPLADGPRDMAWLAKLDMPDLPVRWESRVVRYLEFFKDDPRGRATMTTWLKRSGRYRDAMKKALKAKGLPEDLTALAMIESGMDATARSRVGALGLWQFMPETGKIYGLTQDRWADLRMNQASSTEAAAEFLADLHRRFGSWDLAMAAYNMGYGGVIQAVRRYNTNDYWALSKLEGSLPWETTLYVPKILAVAIVNKNLAAFGYQDVTAEPALEGEEVLVAPGTALASVAQACGTTTKDVEQLNPELRASRTPPGTEDWKVLVPQGKASGCSQNLSKVRAKEPALEKYVVKFGESIEQIAAARHVPIAKIVELNAIAQGEVVRGGTVLLLPKEAAASDKPSDPNAKKEKPVVVVPQDVFVYPDRKRVFYRVQIGDTVREVANVFKVSPDELRRWNEVDPSARLVEGMTLQVFAPSDVDLGTANVMRENDVRIIVTGTEEFFRHWDEKGRRRIVVNASAGDTLDAIGKKHGVTSSLMERINRRGRSEVLSEGERVIVWVPGPSSAPAANADAQASLPKPPSTEPSPTPPLANAPAPEQLPQLP